ncbi:DUF1285 domain-containing protein [Endozoicomonas sp. G2_1]|uniref:DUF1285 domain-containing protein n=1 Tax=Endozoicomonas sp. G2_1 TaxID=2821091 RepID=UPI001ADC607E|nr:DUF1285 domain-containing protein [Endozoicomonas sp. G2_1]MBO9489918.1 DUF1285 domain-containing protein [Endozoicomonas sp. G2_1]
MSLEHLSQQLLDNKGQPSTEKKLPPVELWSPEFCGDIDLQIKADGTWFYGGSSFKRMSLVKLFASVLKLEEANGKQKYFLVTPVEKVGIEVEDVPFVLTQWQQSADGLIECKTNLDDELVLNEQHKLLLTEDDQLYVTVRRNLLARVHRNVYYQWLETAQDEATETGNELALYSGEYRFVIGRY